MSEAVGTARAKTGVKNGLAWEPKDFLREEKEEQGGKGDFRPGRGSANWKAKAARNRSLEPAGGSRPPRPAPAPHPAPTTRPLGPLPALCLSLRLRHFPLVMDGNFPAWVKSDVSRVVVSHTLRPEADPA